MVEHAKDFARIKDPHEEKVIKTGDLDIEENSNKNEAEEKLTKKLIRKLA